MRKLFSEYLIPSRQTQSILREQRLAAPTPERPLHGAGAELERRIARLERSRSVIFFLAPVIAQFFALPFYERRRKNQ